MRSMSAFASAILILASWEAKISSAKAPVAAGHVPDAESSKPIVLEAERLKAATAGMKTRVIQGVKCRRAGTLPSDGGSVRGAGGSFRKNVG